MVRRSRSRGTRGDWSGVDVKQVATQTYRATGAASGERACPIWGFSEASRPVSKIGPPIGTQRRHKIVFTGGHGQNYNPSSG